jgi:hypothetical protein
MYAQICGQSFGLSRSQLPRSLRRGSAAACLLELWVRIPSESWMSVVSVVCCQVDVFALGDHSSRRVLPSLMCLSVIVNPDNEEALAH